jgi:hypothetical protein
VIVVPSSLRPMARRLVILASVVLAFCLAGCSGPAKTAGVLTTITSPPPGHPPGTAPAFVGSTNCDAGTVTVNVEVPVSSACVQVGSDLVITAGYQGTGGSWPGPPTVSGQMTLRLLSSAPSGSLLTARFRAMRTGRTTVQADFVPRNSPCTPTPCTPIPGQPLLLDVTVVASSGEN